MSAIKIRIAHDDDRDPTCVHYWSEPRRAWMPLDGSTFPSIGAAEDCIRRRRLPGHVAMGGA